MKIETRNYEFSLIWSCPGLRHGFFGLCSLQWDITKNYWEFSLEILNTSVGFTWYPRGNAYYNYDEEV